MTLTRVLCPVDFSDASTHALEQAVVLARAAGASITVLHVYLSMLAPTGVTTMDGATEDTVDPAMLQQWRDRTAAQAQVVRDAGVPLDIVIAGGQPVEVILDHAAALDADLIVMGTHGTSGVQHLMLGSVTEKLLRKASCPVLTVPPRMHEADLTPFSRVLCPLDFSECSLKAARAAAGLARDAGGALTLLHVIEWPWHEPPVPSMEGIPPAQAEALLEYRRYLEAGANERLAAVAATVDPQVDVVTRVRFGKPWSETLETAETEGADAIVLGVQGRSAISLGFFGSTTNHVVRAARCPVLTIRD
jgi:nucleotide-binding universal stress UspA family protein